MAGGGGEVRDVLHSSSRSTSAAESLMMMSGTVPRRHVRGDVALPRLHGLVLDLLFRG